MADGACSPVHMPSCDRSNHKEPGFFIGGGRSTFRGRLAYMKRCSKLFKMNISQLRLRARTSKEPIVSRMTPSELAASAEATLPRIENNTSEIGALQAERKGPLALSAGDSTYFRGSVPITTLLPLGGIFVESSDGRSGLCGGNLDGELE